MIAADARLPDTMRAEMISHAADAAPREACGLVVYDRDGSPVRLYRLTNVHPDPARFEIDPVEHFRVITESEARGWRIGAVYHSHPAGPARPSSTDLEAGIDREWMSFIVGRKANRWTIVPFTIGEQGFRRLAVSGQW